jgi:hypothetical protein
MYACRVPLYDNANSEGDNVPVIVMENESVDVERSTRLPAMSSSGRSAELLDRAEVQCQQQHKKSSLDIRSPSITTFRSHTTSSRDWRVFLETEV